MISRFKEMPLFAIGVRNGLLEEFPKHRISGMDPERAEHFIRTQGLSPADYIVIEESDLPKFDAIVGDTNLARGGFEGGIRGIYMAEMQLAVYKKFPQTPRSSNKYLYVQSSPLAHEGILVHELAHASSGYNDYVSPVWYGVYTPRTGFSFLQYPKPLPIKGAFLEEGFAEMMRASYVTKYISTDQLAFFADRMGLDRIKPDYTAPEVISDNRVTPLPFKYMFFAEPQLLPAAPGTSPHAGYALELLCAKDPTLKGALVYGRWAVSGLRQIARLLNAIQPGLYMELKKADYDEEQFITLKSHIIRNIMGGYRNVIQGEGWISEYWEEILKAG